MATLKLTLSRMAWTAAPEFVKRWLRKLQSSPIGSRLAHGSFWSVAGSMSSRMLAMVAAIVSARILGKATYGRLGIIQSTVSMFGTLAGFGMGMTTSKFVAEFRRTHSARAGRIIALCSVVAWVASSAIAIALFFAAPWLCRRTLGAPDLAGPLRIASLLLLFSSVNGAQTGVLTGFEAFRRIAYVNTWAAILNFACVLAGALAFGLPGLVWGLSLAQAGACVMMAQALRHEARLHGVAIHYGGCLAERRILWSFSVPAVLGSLVISPVNWACAAMLIRQPHGFSAMGAYNAANQWFNALMWLPYMLGGVVLPMLSEGFGADDHARSSRLLTASIKVSAAVTLPLVIVGCLFSRLIMSAYGRGFGSEWPVLVETLLAAGIFALMIPVAEVIAAAGRMWMGLFMNLGLAAAMLGASCLLVARGAVGLAAARLIAYTIHATWTFAYAAYVIRKGSGAMPVRLPASLEPASCATPPAPSG